MKKPYCGTTAFVFPLSVMAIITFWFSGCIDLPIESLEQREIVEASEIRGTLRHPDLYGVPERVMDTFYCDKSQYRLYSLNELEAEVDKFYKTRMTYHEEFRRCTDFAWMFMGFIVATMPSAPMGTIEYTTNLLTKEGHKELLFFYRPVGRANLKAMLVDFRSKKIRELGSFPLYIWEIDM